MKRESLYIGYKIALYIYISAITCIFIILLLIAYSIIPRVSPTPKYYTREDYPLRLPIDYTREEARSLLDDLIGLRLYEYEEVTFRDNTMGTANLFFRKIEIEKDLDPWYYTLVLAHEMLHIKYFTSDEIYVNYLTFVYLFESGNDTLRNIAVVHYWMSLTGSYSDSYNMSGQVYSYLNNRNIELFLVYN